jgi:hypothetical protein
VEAQGQEQDAQFVYLMADNVPITMEQAREIAEWLLTGRMEHQ